MNKEQEKLYGYIYRAVNRINEKIYIGQTVTSRWEENQIPIKERWNEEIGDAKRKKRNGEYLRHVENAIIKYGRENFDLFEQYKAYKNQKELDDKETYLIKNLVPSIER